MKKILLVLILSIGATGCGPMVPTKDIQQAITLIRSATEDIRDHNVNPSRVRMGGLIAELTAEEAKDNPDTNLIKELKIKIALEAENIEAMKELPEVMKDLESWSKGE